MFRRYGRYRTEEEARAVASQLRRSGVTSEALVTRHVRGMGYQVPPQPLAVYASADGVDETTRYYRDQAMPFTVPEPSPLDDLGEEE